MLTSPLTLRTISGSRPNLSKKKSTRELSRGSMEMLWSKTGAQMMKIVMKRRKSNLHIETRGKGNISRRGMGQETTKGEGSD